MPSRSPHVPATLPERLTRAQRRERKRRADEAGRNPRQAPPPYNLPALHPGQAADEARSLALSLMRGRAAFELVLREPCPVHLHVRPGQPCEEVPRSLCGARIARCLSRDARARLKSPGRPRQPFYVGQGGAA